MSRQHIGHLLRYRTRPLDQCVPIPLGLQPILAFQNQVVGPKGEPEIAENHIGFVDA